MEENKTVELNNKEFIFVVFISLLVGFGFAFVALKFDNKKLNEYHKVDSNIQDIINVYNDIMENYYMDLDEKSIADGALKGMLAATGDPYSVYMEENEYSSFNISLKGEYEGLGIEITSYNGELYIVGIIPNSPATEMGLQVGDKLLSVDGNTYSNSQDFAEYVQKNDKKDFEIVLQRNEEKHTLVLHKKKIILKSVTSELMEEDGKKIGYIYLSTFAYNSYSQFKEALETLEAQNIDSLIIDLRNNSGGELKVTTNIVSLFLDKSNIIYQIEDKNGNRTKTYSIGNETKKYPIVILTNESTASASEVLTAALKENLYAKVIGRRTYGKGTVQTMLTMNNGSQYKITTKKWLTPNGNWIHGEGIKPDIEVEYNTDNLELEEAKKYLKGI